MSVPVKALVLFPALLLAAASIAAAQETYGTIHITTRLRPDGTRATTKVDPDEHTAIETITDGANKVLSKTTYLLDENGVSLSAIFADAKGKAIYKATYSRDSAGRVSEASASASSSMAPATSPRRSSITMPTASRSPKPSR
jgi:hypothetical protein